MSTKKSPALNLGIYLPLDRRQALAQGEALPGRATGTALFSDLSGFTPLMEHLSTTLGPQRGAEELTRLLNALFTPMIEEVHGHGGSIIAFGGDALTCWFPDFGRALLSPSPHPAPPSIPPTRGREEAANAASAS